MVDMTALSDLHGSDRAAKRMKKRKAAEVRLKAYGLLAIFLAGLALVALLWSVIIKASYALTEHALTIETVLDAAEIDPEGTGDPKEIGRANFDGLVKDVLKARFPEASSRTDRRQLYDIVSSGAQFELRETVMDDPALVGQTIAFPYLASDIADLYLKGIYGRMVPTAHAGTLTVTPVDDGDLLDIRSDTPDFAGAMERVLDNMRTEADRLRRQAALQDNGVRAFEDRLTRVEDPERRAELEAQVAARSAERDRLLAEAEALDARAADGGSEEELTNADPSVLLRLAGGWAKMVTLSPNGGQAEVIMALEDGTRFAPEAWELRIFDVPELARKVSDKQAVWIEVLREDGSVASNFNSRFFTDSDSREPELAGLWGAIVGSFWTMLVTFCLAFPIGVGAAIYLEEFAPKNRLTDFVEVNINNLAAVPSIVFGLLGLAVFIGFFGVPRSSPLVGGIVLALMTLPTVIIASRAAIRAVPPSIRDAALGLGASKLQTSTHHVFPLAMPGILTGTIIGMAQALGETAPLIMIGMVAFIVDVPGGITESATVLPVQVFRWADFPERAFEARTSLAICVLLLFLVIMNALAVFLRKRFERRW
ncbi:phosphate ABC transporter permease PstA [Oceanomicrobium pacificus]|uniref:Phosphate transport system permease protein PstA n=1 Tax=Oceanomicrobium pacificus TaxID=2692916 RepID=A0A6B0TQC0_9RHOB|nr:phosphate ABC transporter permease PstA [Oceanomicrobium pacificus]